MNDKPTSKVAALFLSLAVIAALVYYVGRNDNDSAAAPTMEKRPAKDSQAPEKHASPPFNVQDADYLVSVSLKLLREAEESLEPLQSAEVPAAGQLDPVNNGKLKVKLLLQEIRDVYGYDPRLRAVGTVRSSVVEALLHLLEVWDNLGEWRAAQTEEARRTAGEMIHPNLRFCTQALGKANDALERAKIGQDETSL